jgi:hypothetical protein
LYVESVCFLSVQLQHARLLPKIEVIKSRKKDACCVHTGTNIKRIGKVKNIFWDAGCLISIQRRLRRSVPPQQATELFQKAILPFSYHPRWLLTVSPLRLCHPEPGEGLL